MSDMWGSEILSGVGVKMGAPFGRSIFLVTDGILSCMGYVKKIFRVQIQSYKWTGPKDLT